MKKMLALIISVGLVVSLLFGCGQNTSKEGHEPADESSTTVVNESNDEVSDGQLADETSSDIESGKGFVLTRATSTGYLNYGNDITKYDLVVNGGDSLGWMTTPGEGTCTYDERGNRIRKVWTGLLDNGSGEFTRDTVWTFDENDNCTSLIEKFTGEMEAYSYEVYWTYDTEGKLIHYESNSAAGYTQEVDAADGEIAEKYVFDPDNKWYVRIESYGDGMDEYDSNGNLISSMSKNDYGHVDRKLSYSYYPSGGLKQKIEACEYVTSSLNDIFTKTWDFDEYGNLIKYAVERPYMEPEKYLEYEIVFEYEEL